jgi:polyisoprenoid-binding protein YceI
MANETKWVIDPMHSELHFKVRHLVISTVTGSFKVFSGELQAGEDNFEGADIDFKADVSSINTDNEQRDEHLKSPEFFDAASHPTINFDGKTFTRKDGDEWVLTGDLTIRGTTHPITLDVEFGGIAKDLYARTVAGFDISGKINRKDYGLVWSALTEAGGAVVGDEVKVTGSIEFVKQ